MYNTMMFSTDIALEYAKRDTKKSVKRITDSYDVVFEILSNLQDMYGFAFLQILLTVGLFLVYQYNTFLNCFKQACVFWIKFIFVILYILHIGYGILTTSPCQNIYLKIEDGLDKLYKILFKFKMDLPRHIDETSVQDLTLLLKYIHGRNFKLTALGLFNIDMKTLFVNLGLVVTYQLLIPKSK
nr:unnamed protein product [Callosobruchus chinensis]